MDCVTVIYANKFRYHFYIKKYIFQSLLKFSPSFLTMFSIKLVENKNSLLLNVDGHLHYKHSEPNGNFKWKCRNKSFCYLSVTTTPIDTDDLKSTSII